MQQAEREGGREPQRHGPPLPRGMPFFPSPPVNPNSCRWSGTSCLDGRPGPSTGAAVARRFSICHPATSPADHRLPLPLFLS